MKSAVISRTFFPEVTVPHPDIDEPKVLRDIGRQRKNCKMEIHWKGSDGKQTVRTIYTWRTPPPDIQAQLFLK